MAADKPSPLPGAPRPNWDMPEITDVKIGRANFRPRKARNFDTPLDAVNNAVEIVVTLDAPLPIRAMGPALYVGDAALTESEAVGADGTQIRFWATDHAALADQAPISLGWTGRRADEKAADRRAKFVFRRPQ